MSIITDLVVHTGWSEPASAIKQFVAWFDAPDGPVSGGIARLGTGDGVGWGGHYSAHGVMWGGSYNHFDLGAFLDHMCSVDWVAPHLVQVFALHEDHARLAVHLLQNGQFVEVIDAGGSTDDVSEGPQGEMWFEDEELRRRFGS